MVTLDCVQHQEKEKSQQKKENRICRQFKKVAYRRFPIFTDQLRFWPFIPSIAAVIVSGQH